MSSILTEEHSLPNFELEIKLMKLAQGRSEENSKEAQKACAEKEAAELLISANY